MILILTKANVADVVSRSASVAMVKAEKLNLAVRPYDTYINKSKCGHGKGRKVKLGS